MIFPSVHVENVLSVINVKEIHIDGRLLLWLVIYVHLNLFTFLLVLFLG